MRGSRKSKTIEELIFESKNLAQNELKKYFNCSGFNLLWD